MRLRFGWALTVVLLTLGLAACGDSGEGGASAGSTTAEVAAGTTSSRRPPRAVLAAPVSGDTDHDSSEQTTFDSDDGRALHFGHAADATDGRAITAVVEHYYAALAAEDGSAACALMMAPVAESVPEEIYGASALAHGSGRTCASVASELFAESHAQLVAESRTLRVIGVRVRRRRASALLRFGARSARHILLYREDGVWRIGTLADEDLG